MRTSFDALIIGGGPAGAMAGLLLARMGWHVAVIEWKPRFRNKSCGHCLSPRSLPMLQEADLLGQVRQMSAAETGVLRIHRPTGRDLKLSIASDEAGLVVERSTFDQLLLDRAAESGAVVFQPAGCALRTAGDSKCDVVIHPCDPSRSFTATAPLILGADGLGSSVARTFGGPPVRTRRKFGFAFEYRGALTDHRAINMFLSDAGYLGAVSRDSETVHIAGLIGVSGERPRDPVSFCRDIAQQFDRLRGLNMHCINRLDMRNFVAAGPMPWRPERVAGDGYALLGDAAGFIEPFTGEGMYWALCSAAILAEVVTDERPGQWNAKLATRYAALWQRRIGKAQRRCACIAWAIERPWAIATAHRLLSRSTLERVARRVMAT